MKKTGLKAPSPEELKLALETKKLEVGLLGKFFGGPESSKSNIAGLVLLIIVIVGAVFAFMDFDRAEKYWSIFAPVITLILGYMFGKKEE